MLHWDKRVGEGNLDGMESRTEAAGVSEGSEERETEGGEM